ncbi:FAD-dependent oxidoreductase [Streptomyces sp. AK02-01A]|uniref:FAD-dependent oxidoreductase n=1 Tax=Streptomyces sp. AK02-01A TaxID=3028648 RepID=UPI0029A9E0AE|nr:FAD-dependent monooxygenase [Streptomyces sp. AK02-01A]MDX3850979.1 FAD-dependent monooxygenase [Streptomyces sp. AK02-01A]
MVDTLILGAGPTGLVTAMLLAADGHRVTVVDQDPGPPADGPDGVWDKWERSGVRQFAAAHVLAPAGYHVLRRELPGTVSEILRWGGRRHNMIAGALSLLPEATVEPGDARFDTVAARRPVLEAALLAVAERTAGITLRRGVRAAGLLAEDVPEAHGGHVTGVVLDHGERVKADLVVVASGRRGLATLLPDATDIRPAGTERGFRYYTRHFRAQDGNLPGPAPWPLHHHNSVSVVVVPGDNGTWSMTLVTSGADQDLRRLARSDVWQRTAALYPGLAPWALGEPLGGVVTMGGIRSVRRRLVRAGRPLVTGLVTVGDAWATTNPQFGLGITLGVRQAVLLRDVLREEGTGLGAELARRFDDATERHLIPVWSGLADWEAHRQAEIAADMRGEAHLSADPAWNQHVAGRSVGLRDTGVMRAMAEIGFLLADAREAMGKPGLLARFAELAADAPRHPDGPDRRALLAAVVASD